MANIIDITVKSHDETKPGFDSATRSAGGFKKSLQEVGTIASGVLTADIAAKAAESMVDFAKDSVRAASDLSESVNAVQKVFGDSAVVIDDWGKRNATSIGLSTAEFNKFSTTLGAGLKNAGLDMQDTTKWTIDLQKRAADMASVFNTDVSTALEAIQSGLRGESDPLEQFGVSLTAAAVEAEAMAESGKKSAAQLTNSEKATARLNLIMKQTDSTSGDFADTSDGLANSQRRMSAEIENAKASLGEDLLPVMAKVATAVADAVHWFGELNEHISAPGLGAPMFKDLEANADKIKNLDERLADLVSHGAAKDAADQIVELQQKAKDAGLTVEEFSSLFPKYGEALVQVSHATNSAADAATQHAQALKNEYDASVKASDQMLTLRGSARGLEAAIDDAAKSLKDNGRTLDINTEKGRNNQEALDGIADSAAKARDAILKNGGSMDDAAAAMNRGRTAFIKTATQMGLTASAARRLADQLFTIPTKVQIQVNAVDNATRVINGIYQRLQWINGKQAWVAVAANNANAREGRAHGGVIGAAATGGVRSNSVLVGENGPEVVDLAPGSQVHSNPDSTRMMSGTGGVATVQVEWVGGNAGDEFMQWLKKNIRIRGGVENALGA